MSVKNIKIISWRNNGPEMYVYVHISINSHDKLLNRYIEVMVNNDK